MRGWRSALIPYLVSSLKQHERYHLTDPSRADSQLPPPLPLLPLQARHAPNSHPLLSPSSRRPAMLLMQTDMTSRALMEATLAEVSEAQLSMLSNIFPR